ncbi:YfhO family protein [Microbispora corallina]|uniref:Membrane protein n=1 Tax=Microbispora corallina TaxID=83302 RepID=A0ABQ4FVM2_9ACTN|nr:membrane protein [Microbispora corallina]
MPPGVPEPPATRPGPARKPAVEGAATGTAASRGRGVVLGATAAALLAASMAAAGLCAGDAAAGFFPFGAVTRGVSDLGNQYVPFYAYLCDVLHGHARGDLFVDWASGFGSSYLPDVFYYLTSPFSLLVALFPRARVDLAVYVITVAKIAAGAGAMAVHLRRLPFRGSRHTGLAAVFGAAYGLCGWAVTDGAYNPMWLDGLIAFPLLCLAVEWALAGRRPLLAPLFVAYAWGCDFYTACFATVGAAVVLLVRLSAEPASVRARVAGGARAALYGAIGLGLAAPAVLVGYLAARDAWPVTPRPFTAVGPAPLLGRLLPGSYQYNSPALFVGTFALFAALTLPFNRALPARARAAWTAGIGLVLASMLWQPSVRVWYAFTSPNGSAYREAFVLCGLLVIAGFTSFSRGVPRPLALAAGGVTLAAVVGGASRWTLTTPAMLGRAGVAVAAGAALYGLLLLARLTARLTGRLLRRPGRVRRVASAALLTLLAGVQTAEAAVNVADVDAKRGAHLGSYAAWGPWHDRLRAAVAAADGWPAYRTDPGEARITANDPQLVGGEGAGYYSSMTSTALIGTLSHLGFGWISRGRAPKSLDNPVTDAVFAIGARARSVVAGRSQSRGGNTAAVTLTRTAAAPLVTVRRPPSAGYGPSPYRNQEALIGARVYDVPRLRYLDQYGAELRPGRDNSLATSPDPVPGPSYPYVLRAECRPGDEVYLYAPDYSGGAVLAGNTRVAFTGVPGHSRAPMQRLGTVPATGRLKIKLRPRLGGPIPPGAVGCLDPGRLDRAVGALRSAGATAVQVSGHSLRATLPAGGTGLAVVAAPAIRGWTCAAGNAAPRPAQAFLGLLAVPLDGRSTSVSCSFTPPGLRTGLAVAAAALLAALSCAWRFSGRHKRRKKYAQKRMHELSEIHYVDRQ